MSGSSATSPLPGDASVEPSEALLRVSRGELALDDYLETLVEAGVEHLKGRIPEERLAIVRDVLRDSLREDPDLQARIQALTGQTPG